MQKIQSRLSAQIGTADTDNDQYLAVRFDFFSSRLDSGKFRFVIRLGQIQPSQKVVSRAGFFVDYIM